MQRREPLWPAEPEPAAQAAERISDELAAIYRESYGDSVDSIQTHILDDLVVSLLDIRLLPHERTVLEHSRGEDSIREFVLESADLLAEEPADEPHANG
jgi:uncharacterized protein YbcI